MKLKLNWEKLSYRRYCASAGSHAAWALSLNVVRRKGVFGYEWSVEESPFWCGDFETPEEAMASAEEWLKVASEQALEAFRSGEVDRRLSVSRAKLSPAQLRTLEWLNELDRDSAGLQKWFWPLRGIGTLRILARRGLAQEKPDPGEGYAITAHGRAYLADRKGSVGGP